MGKGTFVWAALVVAATACRATEEGGWTGSVVDSAGVQLVRNPAQELWTNASRWTVEEELRIGTAAGEPEYQFGQIAGIAAGSGGRIFVLDQQGRHIKVFSPDGRYERTLGRPGSGPGELGQAVGPLLMGAGDTLLVPDLANQRVNRYAPDGTSLDSYPIDLRAGLPLRWQATAGGLIATQVRPFALPGQPAPDTMDAIVVRASDGSVLDTLKTFPSGRSFSFAGGMPEITFFSPEAVWALADDGRLFFGLSHDYRIEVYGTGGALERVVTRPFQRTPVRQADRDALLTALDRVWREAGVPPPVLEQLRSGVRFAEFLPAFAQILGGPDRSLWVQAIEAPSRLSAEERETFDPSLDMGGAKWDVFDAHGRYLGVVTLPPRVTPVRFAGQKIYAVARDELGLQYVVRLRVVKPQG